MAFAANSSKAMAQDDMYFTPTKTEVDKEKKARADAKKAKQEERAREQARLEKYYRDLENALNDKPAYYSGISKTDDEYNRRTRRTVQTYQVDSATVASPDSMASDIISFEVGNGEYPDTITMIPDEKPATTTTTIYVVNEADYPYSRWMSRFDDWYYWHSPYWYDPFYDPFWYDPWYGPYWHNPWYNSWCWGGWGYYDPFWYDPWYRPFHPGGWWGGPTIIIDRGWGGYARNTRGAATGTHHHGFAYSDRSSNHRSGSGYSVARRNGGDSSQTHGTGRAAYSVSRNNGSTQQLRRSMQGNSQYNTSRSTYSNSSSGFSRGGSFSGGFGGGGFSGGHGGFGGASHAGGGHSGGHR